MARARNSRRLAIVTAVFSIALAIVLWLGLRGGDHPTGAPAVVLDAREEIAMIEEVRHDGVQAPIVVEVPVPLQPEARPKTPSKKPVVSPPTAAPKPVPAVEAPSAAEVAKLYGTVGRELKALDAAKGMDATLELWPRYRWIRINEWIATPDKRAQITRELERLRTDITKRL